MERHTDGLDLIADEKARELLQALLERGLTVAFAESCTGGLASARVTAIPGSSEAVHGGVVSYSNDVKMKVLGVRKETLAEFGAVSVETAREMAEGLRNITGADIAVSVTGIAGPGGGSCEKPVGTVCFGLAAKDGTEAERINFQSDLSRGSIRLLASDHAIALALKGAKEGASNA